MRLNQVYPKMSLGPITLLLPLQMQVRITIPSRRAGESAETWPIAHKLQFEMLFIFLLLTQEQSCAC